MNATAGHDDITIGPLVAADETLHHQVVNTFGTVASTDANWTEKIWAIACANDGALQVSFGLGKYHNRGVLDAYAGVSRGTEQWTVRASRALHLDPDTTSAGPIHYEIVEALRAVRIVLQPNEVQPIAFDLTLASEIKPGMEGREILRAPNSSRVTNDVVRYHQAGTAAGWIMLDGTRYDVGPSSWSSARDHSWGVRNTVGAPPKDIAPIPYPRNPQSFTSWSPIAITDPDGKVAVLFHYLMESNIPGQPTLKLAGGIEHADGTVERFVSASWTDTVIDDETRRFCGGTFTARLADDTQRRWRYQPTRSGTGFHLGTGLYFGLDGARHGQWRGELHIDGDHFTDCHTRAVAERIHQLRDCVVHVSDDQGSTGTGILQTVIIGDFPEFGTTLPNTFI